MRILFFTQPDMEISTRSMNETLMHTDDKQNTHQMHSHVTKPSKKHSNSAAEHQARLCSLMQTRRYSSRNQCFQYTIHSAAHKQLSLSLQSMIQQQITALSLITVCSAQHG